MTTPSLDSLAHIASHEPPHPNAIKHETTPAAGDASDSASPAAAAAASKPRRLACTWCRQQKSRCDAQERHPLACTRCLKKNLPCQLQADFKRTQKRERLALVEQELSAIKRSVQSPYSAPQFIGVPAMADFPNPIRLGLDHPSSERASATPTGASPYAERAASAPVTAATSVSPEALVCEEKTLESITLDPQSIQALYTEYVQYYHPIMPVVDVAKGPERIYRLCPALFWVIMFVALRRVSSDKTLLLALSPLVKAILAEITISPIARYNPTEADEPIMNACSVYSVQAFILYTLWPPLTSSLSADSSWNTIGVALFQAISIGLHSSGQLLEQEKGNPGSAQYAKAQEQMKTWINCNIVSQNIATAFGFPAFVQFDAVAAQRCEVPICTRHIMEVAQLEDQIAKTLNTGAGAGGHMHVHEKIALLKVLDKQLDDLELKLVAEASHEDGYRKFQCIVARIHLLTWYFLDAPCIPPFELSKGLVRLFNASAALVAHVEMCEARFRHFVRYLPVVSVLHIWQASCFIVKMANSPLKSVVDVAAAKETYLHAIRLVGRASVLKHDIAYRASGIMRNMWQLFRSLDERNQSGLGLKIRSRMTASVFFDCLWLLRDKVGMAKLNMNTEQHSPTSDDSDSDAVSDGAPAPADSEKSTPHSNGSSGRARKKRTLSGVHDAESSARRIIQTIPLDPQPIAASGRSSIFKVVNPSNSPSHRSPTPRPFAKPAGALGAGPTPARLGTPLSGLATPPVGAGRDDAHDLSLELMSGHLESDFFDMNNEGIWKDVDSLMNDFGFHP